MTGTLALAALLMGLAGGPHCVAMCGPACAGVVRVLRAPAGGGPASFAISGAWQLQLGRIAGYAAAGAIVALAAQGLALSAAHVAALRPLWTLLQACVLGWGLALLALGRQPLWSQRGGRALAQRLRRAPGSPLGALAAGALWVLLPCGLLYSALMLAALASGPVEGALVMALFAIGGSAWLLLAPWLWQRLRGRVHALRDAWGTRLAGLLLVALAAHALWLQLRDEVARWCA